MTNNDIIRRLRYAFEFNDEKMIELFALADLIVTRAQVSDWLKKDDDPQFKEITDKELAIFLNGFINDKRGKKEGSQPEPEEELSNNIILRKLKIALNLIDEDIIEILMVAGSKISKHQLSAFFRKPNHHKYMVLQNQLLRNFIKGLQYKYRSDSPYKF